MSPPRDPETRPRDQLPGSLGERVWVVVAAFNEGAKVGQVVRDLRRQTCRVVVVDDGSTDDTGSHARRAGAWLLRHPINRGQGAALQTGLAFARSQGADYLVTFDADGQHRADDLARLLRPLVDGGYQFALGSRFQEAAAQVPRGRRWLLKTAVVFTRLTTGLRVSDAHNGLRAMTARGAEAIHLELDRMAHASEILDQIAASGLPWVEVPVRIRYTEYSLGKGQRGWAALRVAAEYLLGRILG